MGSSHCQAKNASFSFYFKRIEYPARRLSNIIGIGNFNLLNETTLIMNIVKWLLYTGLHVMLQWSFLALHINNSWQILYLFIQNFFFFFKLILNIVVSFLAPVIVINGLYTQRQGATPYFTRDQNNFYSIVKNCSDYFLLSFFSFLF